VKDNHPLRCGKYNMSLLDEGRPVYPRDSAWNYIEKFVPTAAPEDTASDVIKRLMESDMEWDSLTYIYVLNPDKMPVGIVEIEKLFAAQPEDPMSKIMRSDLKTVAPYADQEEVVIKAITGELDAIPVVDSEDNSSYCLYECCCWYPNRDNFYPQPIFRGL